MSALGDNPNLRFPDGKTIYVKLHTSDPGVRVSAGNVTWVDPVTSPTTITHYSMWADRTGLRARFWRWVSRRIAQDSWLATHARHGSTIHVPLTQLEEP